MYDGVEKSWVGLAEKRGKEVGWKSQNTGLELRRLRGLGRENLSCFTSFGAQPVRIP